MMTRAKRELQFHDQSRYWRELCRCGKGFTKTETLHHHWLQQSKKEKVNKINLLYIYKKLQWV
jgi:hypothetical protein